MTPRARTKRVNAARAVFAAMAVWVFASEPSEAEESNEPVDSKATVLKLLPSKPKGFPPRPQTLRNLVCSIWFADPTGDPIPEFRMRIENAGSEEVMFTNSIPVMQIELVSDTGERVRLPGPDSDRIRANSGRRDLAKEGPLLPIEVIGLDGSDGEDSREGNPIPEFSPIHIRPGESVNFRLSYFPNAQRRFETQHPEGLPFDPKVWRIEAALRLSRPDLDEAVRYHSFARWARAK